MHLLLFLNGYQYFNTFNTSYHSILPPVPLKPDLAVDGAGLRVIIPEEGRGIFHAVRRTVPGTNGLLAKGVSRGLCIRAESATLTIMADMEFSAEVPATAASIHLQRPNAYPTFSWSWNSRISSRFSLLRLTPHGEKFIDLFLTVRR